MSNENILAKQAYDAGNRVMLKHNLLRINRLLKKQQFCDGLACCDCKLGLLNGSYCLLDKARDSLLSAYQLLRFGSK